MNKKYKGGKKLVLFFSMIIVTIGSVGFSGRAFSYDSNIAHPNIASFAAGLYNENSGNKLSDEEIDWIKQGTIDEDTPIRWMNHFYDPTTGNGVWYVYTQMSAKKWAQSPSEQEKYTLGDYSWQRAIYDYQHGDKKQAMIGLGHVIHLISDMSVPAHTRNDPHEAGDAYEQFVKYNFGVLLKGLENIDTSIIYFDSLDKYFDDLSNYSNNNFYSDDTIEQATYRVITISKTKDEYNSVDNTVYNYSYALDSDSSVYRLFYKDKGIEWWKKDSKKKIKDPRVLTDYSKHLIPKAVGESAGIIKLFFEEVKKDNNFDFDEDRENVSPLNYLAGFVMKKIMDFKDENDIGPVDVVKADENTVMEIMTEDVMPSEETIEQQPEPIELAMEEPKEIVEELTPEEASSNQEEEKTEEKNPEPELPTVETKSESEEESETPSGEFHFVFSSGGEPVLSPEPTQTQEQDTTDTEETSVIEETPTTTEEITSTSTPETTTTTEEIVTTTEEIVDTIPPNPPELNMSVAISTSTASIMDISWSSLATDLAYYNLEYKTGTDDWLELATSTTSTSKTIDVENYEQYSCRVNAVDINNNVSEWTEKTTIVDWPKTVVINEIAWMGTASNRSTNEWIELYNNSDEDIDLSDWKLTLSGKKINWNNTSSTISARSYYLLERTNDKTVLDIPADAIFTVSGGLSNSGENLILSNNEDEIIDQVDASNGWFAGSTDEKYRTMARINPNLPGNSPSNWKTTNYISFKGKGNNTPNIFGTPRQPNSRYQYLNQISYYYDFDENNTLTLTKEQSPYIYSHLEIPVDYTVEVEPGVVLVGATDDSYIDVEGKFIIKGSEDDPVIFTSRKDIDNFNCEYANYLFGIERDCQSLRDEGENGAEAGDWSRISVKDGASFTADHAKFLYGGQEYYQQGGFVFGSKFPSRVVDNINGEISISNSSFEYSYINPNENKRTYDTIINSENESSGFATTTLDSVVFEGGYRAVAVDGDHTDTIIKNSKFSNFFSENGPFNFSYNLPKLENNILENNFSDSIYLRELSINGEQTLLSGSEYIFNSVQIGVSSTLTVEPGVTIKMANKGKINVEGVLNINGTFDNPVNILPLNDGENWAGIIFHNSTSKINYARLIEGGLNTVSETSKSGMLVLYNSDVELNNVELLNARRPYNMVYSENSNLLLKDSKISWDSYKTGNWIIVGVSASGGHIILDNTYFNEMDYGLRTGDGTSGEMLNMTESHYTSTTVPYYPDTLFGGI